MGSKRIIMNYTVPPSLDDVEVMVSEAMETLPEELMEFCDGVALIIEDFPDEALEDELDIDDLYDLIAVYKSGKEISPGVERKTANDDDVLMIFRRPLLDMWCESGDDVNAVIRNVLIEELGKNFDFSDDEIEEMAERHYQGML